nr:hypothetical protein [Acetobacter malorum]
MPEVFLFSAARISAGVLAAFSCACAMTMLIPQDDTTVPIKTKRLGDIIIARPFLVYCISGISGTIHTVNPYIAILVVIFVLSV